MSSVLIHNCPECHLIYEMTNETTLYLYIRQPLVNHLTTVCPECHTAQTFWELDDDTVDRIITKYAKPNAIIVSLGTFAADRTWQKFCAATGRRYPSRPRFTLEEAKHVENSVKFFRHLLDKGYVP